MKVSLPLITWAKVHEKKKQGDLFLGRFWAEILTSSSNVLLLCNLNSFYCWWFVVGHPEETGRWKGAGPRGAPELNGEALLAIHRKAAHHPGHEVSPGWGQRSGSCVSHLLHIDELYTMCKHTHLEGDGPQWRLQLGKYRNWARITAEVS